MLTFSIAWVVLAATVTVLATIRRTSTNQEQGDVQVGDSGNGMAIFAVLCGIVLLGGFLYIGWQNGLALMQ